jgi:hypothetical protein
LIPLNALDAAELDPVFGSDAPVRLECPYCLRVFVYHRSAVLPDPEEDVSLAVRRHSRPAEAAWSR